MNINIGLARLPENTRKIIGKYIEEAEQINDRGMDGMPIACMIIWLSDDKTQVYAFRCWLKDVAIVLDHSFYGKGDIPYGALKFTLRRIKRNYWEVEKQ